MSFSIPQKIFAEMLGIAVKIIEGRNTIPICECVRLQFNDNGLSIAATNFDSWLHVTMPEFKGKEFATAIVPGKSLYALISAISKDQKISLSIDKGRLKVRSGSSNYQFGLFEASEWPEVKWEEKAELITLPARDFIRGFDFTQTSCATDETRYYLNGVNMRMHEDKTLRFMSSNGHQASLATVVLTRKTKVPSSIIPFKIVGLYLELLRLISEDDDALLEISESKARLQITGTYKMVLTNRLIEGVFPDLDRLVPYAREGSTFLLPHAETLAALRRVNTVIEMRGDKSNAVALEFEDGKLKISTRTTNGSDGEETIKTEGKGKGGTVGVDAMKFISLLSSFQGCEKIAFMFESGVNDSPIVLIAASAKLVQNAAAFSILMPMKI